MIAGLLMLIGKHIGVQITKSLFAPSSGTDSREPKARYDFRAHMRAMSESIDEPLVELNATNAQFLVDWGSIQFSLGAYLRTKSIRLVAFSNEVFRKRCVPESVTTAITQLNADHNDFTFKVFDGSSGSMIFVESEMSIEELHSQAFRDCARKLVAAIAAMDRALVKNKVSL